MFARRTSWDLAPNRLTAMADARRAAGDLIDLTVTNPTACGFDYDVARITAALAQPAALRYQPEPLGLPVARDAVTRYYAARGLPIGQLCLTASTSEAYSHLFKLLCNPGDEVLVPAPSYPLLDLLAQLNDVRLRPYALRYDGEWRLDRGHLESVLAPTARAIVTVNPNNPTGSYLDAGEWRYLQELAARRHLALIADEVFFDYALPPFRPAGLDWASPPALTFVLNGLSKISALPQMKLGWIAVSGPADLRGDALARLEMINDTYLSVDAPIQHAAAVLLETRAAMQPQIIARVAANLASLDRQLRRLPQVTRLNLEGGWSAVLSLPRIQSDDAWAELLLDRAGVLTHPGHFYGFAVDAHLVVSLLPTAESFNRALDRALPVLAEALQVSA